jgi:microcystin-dependent protein
MISAWPLESDSNVIHQDLFYSFINQLYSGEGILKAGDLAMTVDTDGIGVKIAPGGAIVAYDSAYGGKRVFYNSAENKSGPNGHPNPSFTVNTSQWAVIGAATLTRDTGMFNSAPASGKIATSGASAFNQGILSGFYRVNSGELQQVSCWVNAPVGTTVRLTVGEYNSAFAAGITKVKDIAGAGVWQKITLDSWTTAVTCKYLVTNISISAPGSVNVFVDDFQCQQNFDWIQGFEVADPTNPRIDRVVVQIRDSLVAGGGDTSQDAKFRVISGTPTSGATLGNLSGAAAVPSNCFLIGNVLVAAGATSLTAPNLDQTVMATAALNVAVPEVDVLPLGIPYPYCGSAAPTGFLLCDGTAVSRTTYANLFAVLGVSYGAGNGSTTFNLPDMRGRIPVGLGTHVDVNALGDNEGEATVGNRRPKHKHTVSIATQAAHSHGASGSTSSGGSHDHSYTSPTGYGTALGGPDQGVIPGATGATTSSDGSHSHSVSVDIDDGGSHSHSGSTVGPTSAVPTDAPAYMTFNWIMADGI